MNKAIRFLGIIGVLVITALSLAQDIGITPTSPSISVCGDGDFTISVVNDGATPITNVVVRAVVPADFSYRGASDSLGGAVNAGGLPNVIYATFDLTGSDGLPGGTDEWTGYITISPDCAAPIGRQLNITVTYDGGGPITVSSGSITTLKPNLVIEVDPLVQNRSVGEIAGWNITINNTGVGDMYNVDLDATLGAGLTYQTGILSQVIPVIPAGGSVDWDAGAAPDITALVDACEDIKLTVVGTYGGCGSGGTDVCDTVTVEGSVELVYETPNLDYTFAPGILDIPYCGTDTITVNITNSGADAGNINDLYMQVNFPSQVTLVSVSGATYGPDPTEPTENAFAIGDIAGGGTDSFSFTLRWTNECSPVDCETIIFEPHFTDDCGDFFEPPVKELPVNGAPSRPYFTVSKTRAGTGIIDENEEETFNISVTFVGPATINTTANIRDVFPSTFEFVSGTAGGSLSGSTYTWPAQSFNGGDTLNYVIRLRAHYASTDCSTGLANRVIIDPLTTVCGVGCLPVAADNTLSLYNQNILIVDKSGPNTLYVDGASGLYTLTVTYAGPRCDFGSGLQVPPMTITDTLPAGGVPSGPSRAWSSFSGGVLTWDIPAGDVGWAPVGDTYVLTITYNMTISSTAAAPSTPYDLCECGTTVLNTAEAELTSAACIVCDATDSISIAIDCDNEILAPFTSDKSTDVASQERCLCINYTTVYNFNVALNWSGLDYTEQGNNFQTFTGGGLSGTATFTFFDASAGTTTAVNHTITLGSAINLGTVGLPGSVDAGDRLTITYTLCLTQASALGNFVDWSDMGVSGYTTICTTDNLYHEGVWMEAVEYGPSITIAEFCHYVGANCSYVVNKCEDATFRINIDKDNPAYDVRFVVDLQDNYEYVPNSTLFTGVLARPTFEPTITGQLLTWDLGDIAADGSGYLEFRVHKDCEDGTAITSTVYYRDRCDVEDSVTLPYSASRTWGGNVIIKKTPEVIYIRDRATLPAWTIYVTNRGSGTAYNVEVNDTIGAGLEYVSSTISDPTATTDITGLPLIVWTIPEIDPGKTVEITMTGRVIDCADLTNQVQARWGCGVLTGACPPPYTNPYFCQCSDTVDSLVEELPTKVVIIEHTSTPIDLCGEDSTVTIRFRNIGESNAYNLVLTETLPASLEYVTGTESVSCGGCGVSFSQSGSDLIWTFTDAAGMASGAEYTITFDVTAGAYGGPTGCDYTNGDILDLDLTYETVCGDAGDAATNTLQTRPSNPELSVTKSPDPYYGEPTETVSWTITIVNTGNDRAKDVELWDVMPTNVSFVSINPVPASGSGTAADPWQIGDIPVGATVVYTITALVGDCAEGTNTVYTEWGCCTRETASSNSSGVITTPVLSLDQAVVGTATNCGGTITITIDNTGTEAYNINLVNVLPPGYSYVTNSATITGDAGHVFVTEPAVTGSSDILTWTSANINQVNEGEIIVIEFDFTHDAGNCTTGIGGNNTVTLRYDDNPACFSTPTVQVGPITTPITPAVPVLEITKEPETQVIPVGGGMTVSWTITISNTGGPADGTLTLVDTFGDDYNMATIVAPAIQGIAPVINAGAHTVTWTGLSMAAGSAGSPTTITFTMSATTVPAPVEARLNNVIAVTGDCGACVYASATDTAYVGYSNITKRYVNPTSGADITEATIGDTVGIEITSIYYGSGTLYEDIEVLDTLPAGLRYVAGSAEVDGAANEPSVSGQNLTWTLGNTNGTRTFVITFDAIVENITANQDGVNLVNNVRTDYTINGEAFNDSASDTIGIIESVLNVTKNDSVNPATVYGGQTITYFVTVSHNGASNNTAYDIVVTDVVDVGLNVNVASISGSGTYDGPTRTITWTIDELTTAAASPVFTYTATVDTGANPGDAFDNDVRIEWTSTSSDTNADERNGTGTLPTDLNNYFDTATDTVTVEDTANIEKTPDADRDVMIGETMPYTITLELPRATVPDLTVTDTLPEGLAYVAGSAMLNSPYDTMLTAEPSFGGPNNGTTETTLTWDFGGVDATSGTDISITFTVRVYNVMINQDGRAIPNSATATGSTLTFSGSGTDTDSDSSGDLDVIEAVLDITKNDNVPAVPGTVYGGQVITYQVTVSHNGASNATAYDVVVTDVVDVGLNVDVPSVIASGGSWNAGTRTITWTIAAPLLTTDPSLVFTYNATVDTGANPGDSFDNDVRVEWTSINGTDTYERNGTGTLPADLNNYFDTATDTVTVENSANIEKTPDAPRNVTMGSTESYTITLELPRATIPDLIVTDTLPIGVYYVASSATIDPPYAGTLTAEPSYGGPNDGSTTTTLTWDFGGVDATSGTDLEITFNVRVANVMNNQDGVHILNSATATGSTLIFTGSGTDTDSDTSGDLVVNEANITVVKSNTVLGTGIVENGTVIRYTLDLENNGNWTAYDSVITDTVPAKFTNLTWVSGGDSHSITGNTITFNIASLAPLATTTLVYEVTVGATVTAGELLENDVHVTWTSWSGANADERNGTGTLPTDLNNYFADTSNVLTASTAATIAKDPDADRDVTILSPVAYTITLTLPRVVIPTLNITDTLPAGLYYDTVAGATLNAPYNGTYSAVPGVSPPNNGTVPTTLTWSFNNVDATAGTPLELTIYTRVADIDANDDGDTIPANEASFELIDTYGGSHTGSDTSGVLHILVPALTITKDVTSIIGVDGTDRTAALVVEPGDVVTYTITVNNVGTGEARNVTITDSIIEPEFTYVPGSATMPAGVTVSGPNPLVWTAASIPGGGSVTVTFRVTATSALVESTVYTNYAVTVGEDILGTTIPADNTAHVPADTFVLVGGVPTDRAEASVTAAVPSLSLDKEIVSVNGVPYPGLVTVQPGDYIVYRIVVSNTGTGTAYDVDISDTLDTGIGYGDYLAPVPPPVFVTTGTYTDASWTGGYAGTHDSAPGPLPIGTITWDGSTIIPTGHPIVTGVILTGGATYTVEYVVYVNTNIIEGLPVDNLGDSRGKDGANTVINSNTDTTTLATREPFFVTDKTITAINANPANTTVVTVGGIIDYSYVITNVGLGDANTVNVFDTLPIGFAYVAGSTMVNGIAGPDPTVTGRDLSWMLATNVLSGATLSITFQAQVTAGASGGRQYNTAWVEGLDGSGQPVTLNGASITPLDTDSDDRDDIDVYVDIPTLPLVLTKVANPRGVGFGGVVHYTITFTNNRKIAFYDAKITDTLPAGFRYLPGTTLINGARAADPTGSNPYVFSLGTIPPGSTTTLEYYALVSHSASRGANINTAVLAAHDSAGKTISLSTTATVSVKGGGFADFDILSILPRITRPAATPEEHHPARPEEEEERPRPECCLHVALVPVRSQDFGDTLPGYPEIYYQTDIAMYGATELFLTEKRLNPWLEVQGIDPEQKHLMTGLYNRMVAKLGEYAQFNLGDVVMESLLGIPLEYAPGVLDQAKGNRTTPERAASDLLESLAKKAGLSEVPDIQPIFLEYFGSYPYLHDRIVKDELAWEERLMDKNIMPAALGFTMLREASQIEEFLKSTDPTDRFYGLLMLTQALEKTKSISTDLAKTAEFSPPVKYLPHFSRIEVDKAKPGLVWRTTDETSTLYDHVSVLWGLSKLRSVVLHSADPEVREKLPEITERMDEVYHAIEAIHYNSEDKTFVSEHAPGGAEKDKSVAAKDLSFTILALRSVLLENRDLSLNTIDPKRKITEIADFMVEKMMGDDGGVYTAFNYADDTPVVGEKRTLVDNALAIRALLTAYVVTEDRKYRKAALDVYAFMVKELWLEDLLIFVDKENPEYRVVLTPQSIGALIGALRELVLLGDPAMRYDYLDKMSYTTDRILDQSQLQLYENRFYPWHDPITIKPDNPNGRSYVKPIITTIRDKGITYDLAPILVRKMVLNITPSGAIAEGDEDSVSDWNRWSADLHYEVPDLIASALIDDTFVTDEGMYFTSLTRDYQLNLRRNLPAYNPYDTDPGIPYYGAFVGDEVSRFNVKNLTLNSGMGVALSESELVRRLAKADGKSPDAYVKGFVDERAPREISPQDIFGRLVKRVRDTIGIDRGDRFNDIIYLEYVSGKPYYTEDIQDGWDEKTFDKALTISSTASAMVRQILLLTDYKRQEGLSPSENFVRDTMTLVVAAKRAALDDIVREANKKSQTGVPHSFEMTWDDKEKRTVPRILDNKGRLFDDVFAIWAVALFIDAREQGIFDRYRAVLGPSSDDEKLLSDLIDSLIAAHFDGANGTLITGSVNTVEVSKALDILTRSADLMKDGPAKEKLVDLIKKQADFISIRLMTDTGFRPMVGLGDEKIPEDLCEFETLGTNVFPILALYRTWEVTGDDKYLRTALTAFTRFDESKWDQTIGLYLSSGTIYKAPDHSKLELSYTNQELIAAVLLIAKLQPHLEGEQKIITAYHMTTFMNRIMEIASVERYPGNESTDRSTETIFSPEIIRSVKIILTESKGVGKPGDVFTNRIIIDNDCFDEIDRTLSRIRIEETLPDGFHYVPGSTRFNGTPGPDPIGTRTLSWYYQSLTSRSHLEIDYQVVADPGIKDGTFTTSLDVLSLWGYDGRVYDCDVTGVTANTVIKSNLYDQDVIKSCVPCDIGRNALFQ